jgi:hypothetical protein
VPAKQFPGDMRCALAILSETMLQIYVWGKIPYWRPDRGDGARSAAEELIEIVHQYLKK